MQIIKVLSRERGFVINSWMLISGKGNRVIYYLKKLVNFNT
jgi:hypothetical protein